MFSVVGRAVLTLDDCTDVDWYCNNSNNPVSGNFYFSLLYSSWSAGSNSIAGSTLSVLAHHFYLLSM